MADIAGHTAKTVALGEAAGGWEPLPEKDIFEIEYWELEQAKLRKGPARKVHQGKVALVTGCAAGIGFAIAESLAEQGAQVVGLDIDKEIPEIMKKIGGVGIVVNLTEDEPVQEAIDFVVREFGGIDIVVSNAGIFPKNEPLDVMAQGDWDRTIAINLTSHQKLMHKVIPFVKLGIDASIIFVGSRNFKAPGPGASRLLLQQGRAHPALPRGRARTRAAQGAREHRPSRRRVRHQDLDPRGPGHAAPNATA